MKRLFCWLAIVWLGFCGAKAEVIVVIEGLDAHDNITFNTISNAQSYRIEWAPGAGAPWTNFQAAAEMLDELAPSSEPSITVKVPMLYRVVATVTNPPPVPPPPGMVFVQGGSLPDIGNGVITVDSFHIGKHEVTWGEWKAVRAEAAARGYDIGNLGAGCADGHPVHTVNWYDVVKWCNLRSEIEGRTPAYTIGGNVYTNGQHNNVSVNAAANGYRLPTDAQWEYAARGGIHSQGYEYSGSDDFDAVAWHWNNSGGAACIYASERGTWPVGQKAANELGIKDMSGNVWEWCFDWHPSHVGSSRVSRGGAWTCSGGACGVGYRNVSWPGLANALMGFRAVLPAQ